jgi:hypothetical protein
MRKAALMRAAVLLASLAAILAGGDIVPPH